MTNSTDIFSLETTLSAFFDCITKSNQTESAYPFLNAITSFFHGQTAPLVIPFDLDDDSTAEVIAQLKDHLALPPEIDFKGTMIMVRIPAQVPNGFNPYNFMS